MRTQNLLIGSMATAASRHHPSDSPPGIHIVSVDLDSGMLTDLGTASRAIAPSYLSADNAGNFVVATRETRRGGLAFFERTGQESLTRRATIGGVGPIPCHVEVLPSADFETPGIWAVASSYATGQVSLANLVPGRGGRIIASLQVPGHGLMRGHQDRSHAHFATRIGRQRLAVADLGLDKVHFVSTFRNGLKVEGSVELPPGSGPRHIAVMKHKLLVSTEFSGELVVVDLTSFSGRVAQRLSSSQVSKSILDLTPALTSHVALSPTGSTVYVGNRGPGTIAAFSTPQDDGLLTFAAEAPVIGCWPRHFVVLTGRHNDLIITANERNGTVTSMSGLATSKSGIGFGLTLATVKVPAASCVLPVPP